jgi:hypothetical protein
MRNVIAIRFKCAIPELEILRKIARVQNGGATAFLDGERGRRRL